LLANYGSNETFFGVEFRRMGKKPMTVAEMASMGGRARAARYTLPYSGLADSYNMLGLYCVFPQTEVMPKAKAAAIRAVEIDEQLAEAHASLGWTKFAFDWDWSGAEREFRRAIELNPGYATAHRWLANCLTQEGRPDKALAEISRAKELDPVSLVTNAVLGDTLYYARHYDQAIEQERLGAGIGLRAKGQSRGSYCAISEGHGT
jgi:tetratricopeptide (TPR) repeat protein